MVAHLHLRDTLGLAHITVTYQCDDLSTNVKLKKKGNIQRYTPITADQTAPF